MSDLFSAQLLQQMNGDLSFVEEAENTIGEIRVKYVIIPGFRKNSNIVWAMEEEFLYYRNAKSDNTKEIACKCYVAGCYARLYIREDKTAYRLLEHDSIKHGSMYTTYKHMYSTQIISRKHF